MLQKEPSGADSGKPSGVQQGAGFLNRAVLACGWNNVSLAGSVPLIPAYFTDLAPTPKMPVELPVIREIQI